MQHAAVDDDSARRRSRRFSTPQGAASAKKNSADFGSSHLFLPHRGMSELKLWVSLVSGEQKEITACGSALLSELRHQKNLLDDEKRAWNFSRRDLEQRAQRADLVETLRAQLQEAMLHGGRLLSERRARQVANGRNGVTSVHRPFRLKLAFWSVLC